MVVERTWSWRGGNFSLEVKGAGAITASSGAGWGKEWMKVRRRRTRMLEGGIFVRNERLHRCAYNYGWRTWQGNPWRRQGRICLGVNRWWVRGGLGTIRQNKFTFVGNGLRVMTINRLWLGLIANALGGFFFLLGSN